jgi:hypothetical protein
VASEAIPASSGPAAHPDVLAALAEKFGQQAIARFFGDVPEEDKAAILDNLVGVLGELTQINRYFAEQIFNRFGDEETGELRKKPDIRDFMTAWSEATIRLMAEEEITEGQVEQGGGAQEGGEELPPEEEAEQPPVVDAEFRTVK